MVEVIPLGAGDPSAPVHTIVLPIPIVGSGSGRFFAVIVEDHGPRGAVRRAAHLATTMENLAEREDLPREPAAWFGAYINCVREELRGRRDVEHPPLSICLGIAYPHGEVTALTLARAGAIGAFLMLRHAVGQQGSMAAGTAPVDVLEPAAPTSTPRFDSAVDGAIRPGDLLIIGTAALVGRATRSVIVQSCVNHTPSEAAPLIERALLRDHPAARGIIVSVNAATGQPRSQRSMDTFLATATSTERFLTPRLGPMLHQYVAQLRSTTSLVIRQRSRRAPRRSLLPIVQHVMRLTVRTVVVAARSIGAMVVDGLRILSIAAVRSARTLHRIHIKWFLPLLAARGKTSGVDGKTPDVEPAPARASGERARGVILPDSSIGGRAQGTIYVVRTTFTSQISRLKSHVADLRSWYRSLPLTSQRLFLLTVLFAALFLISTGALWRRRTHETTVTAYNTTIATIEELRSVAEARLLFGDRAAARDALREAEAALTTLPRTSRARRERAVVLDGEIRAALDRARLVTRIQQPLRVGRGGEGGIPFAEIGNLSVVGTQLVAAAADGSAVAVLDPRGGATKSYDLAATKLPSRPLRTLTLDDRSIMLIDAGAHTMRVDVRSGSATTMTIEQPPPGIRDAALFQGRLYLLHTDGTITRHARTTGGFGRGTTWLQASNAPPNVRRLFVAGPVFLASGDGALAAYFAGRKRDTDLRKDIDPLLTATALLAAPPDQELLYLGDPIEGRIIALKTSGELIGQIQSDAFRNMTDLAINPTGTAIYVLHGNEISVMVPPKSAGG